MNSATAYWFSTRSQVFDMILNGDADWKRASFFHFSYVLARDPSVFYGNPCPFKRSALDLMSYEYNPHEAHQLSLRFVWWMLTLRLGGSFCFAGDQLWIVNSFSSDPHRKILKLCWKKTRTCCFQVILKENAVFLRSRLNPSEVSGHFFYRLGRKIGQGCKPKGDLLSIFTSRTIVRTFVVLFRINFPGNWGDILLEYVPGQPRKLNLCTFVVQTAITLVANEYSVTYELLFGQEEHCGTHAFQIMEKQRTANQIDRNSIFSWWKQTATVHWITMES